MSKVTDFIQKRRLWFIGGLVLLILLGGAYFFLVPREKVVMVRTAKAVQGDLVVSFTTNGKIEPIHGADMVTSSEGRVAQILVKEGSQVEKGDAIIKLDNPDVDRLYQDARFQYEQARNDFSRDSYLYQNGALTQMEYETSRTKFESARASYQNLRDKLYLSAPLSGKLYAIYPKIGEPLTMGAKVASIGDISKLQARIYVDEPDVGSLSMGLTVRITADAQPGKVWTGKIIKIPSVLVPQGSRTVSEVICSIEKDQKGLIPNMNIDVDIIEKEGKNLVKVPVEAVYRENGKTSIYLIQQERLVKTPVEVILSNNTESALRSGVKAGDEVVSDSEAKVEDGVKIVRKVVQ